MRVSGWLNGWAIYSNRQERNSNHLETTFVGAYFDEPALADALQDRPRSGQALGVVGHCADVCADNYRQWEEERAAAEREGREPSQDLPFCMPVGFCHYYDDPYVSVQQVR